ncbi:MAG TPA: hypothetical protein VJO35_03015 [Terriglobales bacterium]|nr:hypothetical protein [Terriglobales bacterium]
MAEQSGKIPPPLSAAELRKLILEAIDETADIGNPETFHARFGHLERDLQIDDVIHGLEQLWSFDRPPVFNNFHWQWKYYVATENIDGDPILIVIAVDTLDRSFEVITRWRQ